MKIKTTIMPRADGTVIACVCGVDYVFTGGVCTIENADHADELLALPDFAVAVEDAPPEIKAAEIKPTGEKQPLNDASFNGSFIHWKKAFESGKKTADEIMAIAETKGILSDEQRAKILALAADKLDTNNAE